MFQGRNFIDNGQEDETLILFQFETGHIITLDVKAPGQLRLDVKRHWNDYLLRETGPVLIIDNNPEN